MEILNDGKNELEFVLNGERHSFPGLLKNALLKDSKVIFASYKLNHLFDDKAEFILKTDGKPPKKALSDALKIINSDFADFEKGLKSALK